MFSPYFAVGEVQVERKGHQFVCDGFPTSSYPFLGFPSQMILDRWLMFETETGRQIHTAAQNDEK